MSWGVPNQAASRTAQVSLSASTTLPGTLLDSLHIDYRLRYMCWLIIKECTDDQEKAFTLLCCDVKEEDFNQINT